MEGEGRPTAGGDARLKRSITLPLLLLYGVGTMVGGGFYALLGEVAREAGMYTPVALAFSGLLACLSALSFAELSSRFPFSAGEARYVQEGFGRPSLGATVGYLVILTGVVSAATLSVATIRFLQDFVQVSPTIGIPVLVVLLGLVAAWGVSESVGLVVLITLLEVGALIYVAIGADLTLADLPSRSGTFVPPLEAGAWVGIFSGGFLAFYAFIGFEDMVNMAEEVKDARKTLPRGILMAVVFTTALYILVSAVAVSNVPPMELAEANVPVAAIMAGGGWFEGVGIRIVSLLTGVNGALVQIVMGSRVAYGLAKRGQAPRWMGIVHPRTRTPLLATITIALVVLALAMFFPLVTLARLTSTVMLVVFASVNLALWRVKGRDPDPEGEGPRIPRWVPLLASCACVLVLVFQAVV